MIARIKTATLIGVEARGVEVEVHLRGGQERFTIIGLGDGAVRESKDRILAAMRQSGFKSPRQILVNLAPAELRKEGSTFDLPIAIGILVAAGIVPSTAVRGRMFFGELGLDGRIRSMRGVVAYAIHALERSMDEVIVPWDNSAEAGLINGIKVGAVATLAELVRYLAGGELPDRPAKQYKKKEIALRGFDDVWGQGPAKRALLIAATGGHNALLIGPPGCGKSMLAQRFNALLPPLSEQEMLEVVRIHSIAGLPLAGLLGGERPYRNPHHVASDVGLIGGGSVPKPGEVSLAHRGVLFLDELPEYRRSALEALRQPLESGQALVTRARGTSAFPARFQLIAAMNPCPCGRLGAAGEGCLCSRSALAGYLRKLSQPILDRIDLHVELSAVPIEELTRTPSAPKSQNDERLREAVLLARARQEERQGKLNAELSGDEIGNSISIKESALALLERAAQRVGLSARGYIRVLRVAVSVADLEEADEIEERHIAEAIGFRSLERLQQYCMAA